FVEDDSFFAAVELCTVHLRELERALFTCVAHRDFASCHGVDPYTGTDSKATTNGARSFSSERCVPRPASVGWPSGSGSRQLDAHSIARGQSPRTRRRMSRMTMGTTITVRPRVVKASFTASNPTVPVTRSARQVSARW